MKFPMAKTSGCFVRTANSLRAIGRPNIGRPDEERHGPSGIYYYEWKKNRLRLVKFAPVGSYLEPDPPSNSKQQVHFDNGAIHIISGDR